MCLQNNWKEMITHFIYPGKATYFIFKAKCLLDFTYTEQSRHDLELQSLPMLKSNWTGSSLEPCF